MFKTVAAAAVATISGFGKKSGGSTPTALPAPHAFHRPAPPPRFERLYPIRPIRPLLLFWLPRISVVGGPGVVLWNAYRIQNAYSFDEWAQGVKWVASQRHGAEAQGWWLDRIEYFQAQPTDVYPSMVPIRTYARVELFVVGGIWSRDMFYIDVTGQEGIALPFNVSLPYTYNPRTDFVTTVAV